MFFFQAEDGIRDYKVTGVQTCALPIFFAAKPDERPQAKTTSTCGGRLNGNFASASDVALLKRGAGPAQARRGDRESTRLDSSHLVISYAGLFLRKKKNTNAKALTLATS